MTHNLTIKTVKQLYFQRGECLKSINFIPLCAEPLTDLINQIDNEHASRGLKTIRK